MEDIRKVRNYIEIRISSENIEVSIFTVDNKYMVEMRDNDCDKQITLKICPDRETANKAFTKFIKAF